MVDRLNNKIAALDANNQTLVSQLDHAKSTSEILENEKRDLLDKLQRVTTDMTTSHREIDKLRRELEALKTQADQTKDYEQRVRHATRVETENKFLSERVASLTAKMGVLEEKTKLFEKQQVQLESERDESLRERAKLMDETAQLLAKLDQANDKIEYVHGCECECECVSVSMKL